MAKKIRVHCYTCGLLVPLDETVNGGTRSERYGARVCLDCVDHWRKPGDERSEVEYAAAMAADCVEQWVVAGHLATRSRRR